MLGGEPALQLGASTAWRLAMAKAKAGCGVPVFTASAGSGAGAIGGHIDNLEAGGSPFGGGGHKVDDEGVDGGLGQRFWARGSGRGG